jgi:hypothetical protein
MGKEPDGREKGNIEEWTAAKGPRCQAPATAARHVCVPGHEWRKGARQYSNGCTSLDARRPTSGKRSSQARRPINTLFLSPAIGSARAQSSLDHVRPSGRATMPWAADNEHGHCFEGRFQNGGDAIRDMHHLKRFSRQYSV